MIISKKKTSLKNIILNKMNKRQLEWVNSLLNQMVANWLKI